MATEYKNIVVSLAARLGNLVPAMKQAGDAAAGFLGSTISGGQGLAAFAETAERVLHAKAAIHLAAAGVSVFSAVMSGARGETEQMVEAMKSLPFGFGHWVSLCEEAYQWLSGSRKQIEAFTESLKKIDEFEAVRSKLVEIGGDGRALADASAPGATEADTARASAEKRRLTQLAAIEAGLAKAHNLMTPPAAPREQSLSWLFGLGEGPALQSVSRSAITALKNLAWSEALDVWLGYWRSVEKINSEGMGKATETAFAGVTAKAKMVRDSLRDLEAAAIRESDTIGMTPAQVKLYDLGKAGASAEKLAQAKAAQQTIDWADQTKNAIKATENFATTVKDQLKDPMQLLADYMDKTKDAVVNGNLTPAQAAEANRRKEAELTPQGARDFGILGDRMSLAAMVGGLGSKDDAVAKNTGDMLPVLKSIDKRLADADFAFWED